MAAVACCTRRRCTSAKWKSLIQAQQPRKTRPQPTLCIDTAIVPRWNDHGRAISHPVLSLTRTYAEPPCLPRPLPAARSASRRAEATRCCDRLVELCQTRLGYRASRAVRVTPSGLTPPLAPTLTCLLPPPHSGRYACPKVVLGRSLTMHIFNGGYPSDQMPSYSRRWSPNTCAIGAISNLMRSRDRDEIAQAL